MKTMTAQEFYDFWTKNLISKHRWGYPVELLNDLVTELTVRGFIAEPAPDPEPLPIPYADTFKLYLVKDSNGDSCLVVAKHYCDAFTTAFGFCGKRDEGKVIEEVKAIRDRAGVFHRIALY